jgi:hypothetical protein
MLETGTLETGMLETGMLETGMLETGMLETGMLETGMLATGTLETGTLEIGERAGAWAAEAGDALEAVAGADFAPLRGAEKVFTDGSDGAGRRIITSLCAPFVAAGLELWAGLVIGISGRTTRAGRAGSRNGRWGAGTGARVRTA